MGNRVTTTVDVQLNGIIVGRDPVALDRTCHGIIEEKREEMKLPSLKRANREPKYISTAATLVLGIGEPSKINLIHAQEM